MIVGKKLSGMQITIVCHHWMFINPPTSPKKRYAEGSVHRGNRCSLCGQGQLLSLWLCVEMHLMKAFHLIAGYLD